MQWKELKYDNITLSIGTLFCCLVSSQKYWFVQIKHMPNRIAINQHVEARGIMDI